MNFKEQMQKCKNENILNVCEYLLTRNDLDLDKQNKTIAELENYIYIMAKEEHEKQNNGNCVMISRDIVYGWAVHYYDEEEIAELKVKQKTKKASKNTVKSVQKDIEETKKQLQPKEKVKKPKKKELENEMQLSLF